jgi:hypothetical protein
MAMLKICLIFLLSHQVLAQCNGDGNTECKQPLDSATLLQVKAQTESMEEDGALSKIKDDAYDVEEDEEEDEDEDEDEDAEDNLASDEGGAVDADTDKGSARGGKGDAVAPEGNAGKPGASKTNMACAGKAEGDDCTIKNEQGKCKKTKTFKGTSIGKKRDVKVKGGPDQGERMFCKRAAADGSSPHVIHSAACEGKADGDACTFMKGAGHGAGAGQGQNQKTGTCKSTPSGLYIMCKKPNSGRGNKVKKNGGAVNKKR